MPKIIKFIALFLLLPCSVFANKNSDKSLFYKHQAELVELEKYLNSITSFNADFTQTLENDTTNGKFFLSRNNKTAGKMRIEYNGKPKILVVVNGSILSYHDLELDEISRISTNTTPASLLTRPNISFLASDITISNVVSNNQQLEVTIIKKNRPDLGQFTLKFAKNPWQFLQMQVKNDLEQIITISLSNIKFENNPNHLFIIKNNEDNS